MTRNTKLTTWGLLAALGGLTIAPAMADQQSDKNNMRNLAIGGAAVAAYGLFSHNNVATLLGAAGAALAGSQYEKDRQEQSQDSGRFYHYNNYGYGNNGYNQNGFNRDGFNRDGFNRDGFNRDGYNQDGYNRDGYNRDGYDRNGFNRNGDSRNSDNTNWHNDHQSGNNQNNDRGGQNNWR